MRHTCRVLQLLHLLLRLKVDVLVKLGRLLVVCVAIVVMQVTLERLPRLCLRVPCIGSALLFEPVAVVPARAMLRPDAHAHPAELVSAFPARHVIAASVLLDGGVTPRALLCVCRYPVGGLGVVLALLEPPLHQRAWRWLVVVQCTAKTKIMPTVAMDCRNCLGKILTLDGTFQGVFAVGGGAPFQVLSVVDVGSCKEDLVSGTVSISLGQT
jgi:hypothetical protein